MFCGELFSISFHLPKVIAFIGKTYSHLQGKNSYNNYVFFIRRYISCANMIKVKWFPIIDVNITYIKITRLYVLRNREAKMESDDFIKHKLCLEFSIVKFSFICYLNLNRMFNDVGITYSIVKIVHSMGWHLHAYILHMLFISNLNSHFLLHIADQIDHK